MGGGDKCLLEVANQPLLVHTRDRLRPQVSELILNANGAPERFAAFGLPVVPDPVEGFAGPLAGVLAGLGWAQNNAPNARWIVTAATDTPFFPRDLAARLFAATEGQYPAIALASSGDRLHPVFGLWPTALADNLREALEQGTRKVLDWTDRHVRVSADFPIEDKSREPLDPFFNVNRPEDLARAESVFEAVA
jgi:molybdopterin-guanine dinucleotide biosynthesis protein A